MTALQPFARLLLAASLATGAAAVMAQAAAPAAAAAPSAAKKALIDKVLQLQQPGIEGLGLQLANQTATQVLQVAGQALGRVPADKREAVGRELQAEVKKFFDEIAPMLRERALKLAPETLGAALDKDFNDDELRTLIAWLESPVQRKYQQASGAMSQDLAKRLVAETQPQVAPKLKALEQTLGAKLNAAAGTAPASAAPRASGPAAPKK